MSKIVLVTGASSGLGQAIAEYLFHKGYVVFGTSRNPKTAVKNGVIMKALDVTKPETPLRWCRVR